MNESYLELSRLPHLHQLPPLCFLAFIQTQTVQVDVFFVGRGAVFRSGHHYVNQFYFAGSLLSRIIVKYVVYCATNIDILLKANWKELVATPAVFLICGGHLFTVWNCWRRVRAFFQFFPDELLQDFQDGQHKPDPVMHFVGFVTIAVKFSGGRPVLLDEINATPDFISIFCFPILFLGWGLVCFLGFIGWEKWPQKDSDDFVTYGRRVLDLKLCQNQD